MSAISRNSSNGPLQGDLSHKSGVAPEVDHESPDGVRGQDPSFLDVDALASGGLDLKAATVDKTFAWYFEAAFERMHSAEVNFAKFSVDAVNPYSYGLF